METTAPISLNHPSSRLSSLSTPSAPPLVPVLAPEGTVDRTIDVMVTSVARAARDGDVDARNALFAAFELRLARIVRRQARIALSSTVCRSIDFDDISQEAFVVFADLIDRWPDGESFVAYVLGYFPWALKNAVRRMVNQSRSFYRPGHLSRMPSPDDERAEVDEAATLLRALAAEMSVTNGAILVWRLQDGDTFEAIAERLGVGRRTVMRAWDRIVGELRRSGVS